MNKTEELLRHEDIAAAVRNFVQRFESANKVEVSKYRLENDVARPDSNFSSGIIRLKFEYGRAGDNDAATVVDSVLLKVPSLGAEYATIAKTAIYDNEIYVYQHLWPRLYELWSGERFSPAFHGLTDAKVLILEDLTAKGFQARDKQTRLDLAHGRVAFATLAKYHAVTVEYLQQMGRRRQTLPASLIEPLDAVGLRQHCARMHRRFLRLTAALVPAPVHQKLRNLADKLQASSAYLMNCERDGLTVIAHGDFWTANILFGYDSVGQVNAARMVDWQLCRRTSPVVDLIYGFVTCLQFDVFEASQDELLNLYVRTLNDTLSSLRCDRSYTRAQLDDDVRNYKYVFLYLIVTALPLAVLDKEAASCDSETERLPNGYLTLISKWITYLDNRNFL